MDAAERLTVEIAERRTWAEICDLHPNEWVCLLEVENAADGAIGSARVIGHDRSMRRALAQMGVTQPDTTVVHTQGRPVRTPRIEITDEIRDIIRPQR